VTGHRPPAMTASRPSAILQNLQHTTRQIQRDRIASVDNGRAINLLMIS
jgi:hypothetical protein